MKLNALKAIAIASISLTGLSSCNKDNKDKVDISVDGISGTYKLVASTYKYNSDPEEDLFAIMPACQKDNTITLNKDKTYTTQDVGVQCTPPIVENGQWDVLSSTKMLVDGEEATLDSYDGTTLRYTVVEKFGSDTEVYKTTIQRQ